MTGLMTVVVKNRTTDGDFGFTTVSAEVNGGMEETFLVKNHVAGGPGEIHEILAQWEQRQESRDVTRAGMR